jgi:membrane protease YdiL (CAAX protease family)
MQSTGFLKRHALIMGIVLMFLLTWPIYLANMGLLPIRIPDVAGLMIGYGLAIAALIMTGLTLGGGGVIALLKRFLIWRVGWKWYLVTFLLYPAISVSAVVLNAAITQTPIDFSTVVARDLFGRDANLPLFILPFFLVDLITNGEETGWRGYLLPRLQVKYGALVSSLIVGVLWGLWHIPKFLGPGSSGALGWFLVETVADAVLYTWLYNNTRGSLLLVTLFHSSANTAAVFLPIANTVSGNNLSALTVEIALSIIAAIVVTVTAGPERLSRTAPKQVQE